MNLKKIIKEEFDNLEWIKSHQLDLTVTEYNVREGLRVVLKKDSDFSIQSRVPGTVLLFDYDEIWSGRGFTRSPLKSSCSVDTNEDCTWVFVLWDDGNGYNNYRIGPNEFDLDIYVPKQ